MQAINDIAIMENTDLVVSYGFYSNQTDEVLEKHADSIRDFGYTSANIKDLMNSQTESKN